MLTDAQGRPIASEGNDAKYLKIFQQNVNGKYVWGIEYHPSMKAFEYEEVMQVLGNVIAAVSQQARASLKEAMLKQQMQQGINKLAKEE